MWVKIPNAIYVTHGVHTVCKNMQIWSSHAWGLVKPENVFANIMKLANL